VAMDAVRSMDCSRLCHCAGRSSGANRSLVMGRSRDGFGGCRRSLCREFNGVDSHDGCRWNPAHHRLGMFPGVGRPTVVQAQTATCRQRCEALGAVTGLMRPRDATVGVLSCRSTAASGEGIVGNVSTTVPCPYQREQRNNGNVAGQGVGGSAVDGPEQGNGSSHPRCGWSRSVRNGLRRQQRNVDGPTRHRNRPGLKGRRSRRYVQIL
jgi:hypothetical protein